MSGSEPSVTVVVPSFNQGRFIREALDSILDQGYPDLEVLVMDGGSTDGTVAILRGYGDRIQFVSGPDRGQSDALNRGFRRANGEFVGWLNSDDRYCPGAISRCVAKLAARPALSMVYGEADLIGENGKVLRRFPATQAFDLWKLVHVSDFIMQPTVFMRACALRACGGLDESLRFGMDWDLWIRLACHGEVACLNETIAQTREYGGTKTATGGFGRWRELKRIMTRYGASGCSPGAITYGLDTLRRKWPAVFGPSSAGDIETQKGRKRAALFLPVHRLVTRLIESQLRETQGIFIDRWATDRARLAVPWNGERAILTVSGEVPAPPEHFPLTIEVRAAGHRESIEIAAPGAFEVGLEMESGEVRPRPLEIEMRASRTFRAERDTRRLAFKIKKVRMNASGEVRVVWPLG